MTRSRRRTALIGLVALVSPWAWSVRADTPPEVLDPALRVTLFAEHPEIVTPIGVAVADDGRVFVIESHTHSPRADYDGPKMDRIKVFVDEDGDGMADHASVFADRFDDAMNLAFGPDGALFVCHRAGVTRLIDRNGDGTADDRAEILRLETKQTYDHSCLLGIVVAPDGKSLVVSRGNVGGFPYVIRGTDGSEVAGYEDGGNLVSCDLDGGNVREIATGFWNPFAMAFDRAGRLLCVDNDPDSRGPNRLVHIIEGGDYGFKSLYGPSGLHPFSAWDGDLPGTLPMVSGTEEAPSGLLVCDDAALPASYRGHLLATSWGGHVIERFRPKPEGVSIIASREPWMTGTEEFRPVGIAAGPDGSIYVTDWMRKDYPNHGEGRIWRIAPAREAEVEDPRPRWSTPEPVEGTKRLGRILASKGLGAFDQLVEMLSIEDPFIQSTAISVLARPDYREQLVALLNDPREEVRLGALLGLRRSGIEPDRAWLPPLLADPAEEVRMMALIWVGERGVELPDDVLKAAVTTGEASARLVEVYLAAVALLGEEERQAWRERVPGFQIRRAPGQDRVLGLLEDESAPDRVRAIACRLVADADRSGFDRALIRLAEHDDPELRAEAVRTMGRGTGRELGEALLELALDPESPAELRADALVGLARQPADLLADASRVLDDPDPAVRLEAVKALRSIASDPAVNEALTRILGDLSDGVEALTLAEQIRFTLALPPETDRPDSIESWVDRLAEGGDAGAGRRVFLHPTVACSDCHKVEGRGGMIGPDLSVIGRSSTREQLLRSILEPSAEIAPEYQGYMVATADGQVLTGIQFHFRDGGRSISMILQDGREIRKPLDELEEYGPSRESLMPEGLDQQMTIEDFRNLLAYLESLR